MRGFLSPNWRALFVVIEDDVGRTFEHFVQQWRAFVGKYARGFW